MSNESNHEQRLASEDSVSVVPGGRDESDPATGGSAQPVVNVGNPKDPDGDNQ